MAAAFAAGCGGGSAPVEPGSRIGAKPASGSSPIQHVVLVVQENRTFNDFFATYPGADGTTTGYAEANYSCSPPIQAGAITLTKTNLALIHDLRHNYANFVTALDGGKMDGFDLVPFASGVSECSYPYTYTDPNQIKPYWEMANSYALAEHMFTPQGSDSFTAHQDLIAGSTIVAPGEAMIDLPNCSGSKCYWGCDAPPKTITHLITKDNEYIKQGPFPCTTHFKVTYRTLRHLLDSKSISWKYYVPPVNTINGKLFNAYDVVASVRYGPEWNTNIVTPETQIFNDITYGQLPAMSWVIPDFANSDHPGNKVDNGPSWVASIVNAIGASSYWNSTAIIVVWDDWGGLYDNAAPQSTGYGGLGLRVPALVISPYAKPGYISQTDYDFGSILKYVEDNWSLGNLGGADKHANSLIDCFNYSQSPIRFKPIAAKYNKAYFLHEKPSLVPNDTDY